MRSDSITCLICLLTALFTGGCGQAGNIRPDNPGNDQAAEQQGTPGSVERSDDEQGDPSAPGIGMVEMEVVHVGEGPGRGAVVVLRERFGEQRLVPMVIGEAEAGAISLRLLRQQAVRPLTHDLIESLLYTYGIRIVKLEIDDLKDGIFLGRLYLQDSDGVVTELDTRPSDGIALSLGAKAPIFMSIDVVESAGRTRSEWQEDTPTPDEEDEENSPVTL